MWLRRLGWCCGWATGRRPWKPLSWSGSRVRIDDPEETLRYCAFVLSSDIDSERTLADSDWFHQHWWAWWPVAPRRPFLVHLSLCDLFDYLDSDSSSDSDSDAMTLTFLVTWSCLCPWPTCLKLKATWGSFRPFSFLRCFWFWTLSLPFLKE